MNTTPQPGRLCDSCGTALPAESRFCLSCGHPVDDGEALSPGPSGSAPAAGARLSSTGPADGPDDGTDIPFHQRVAGGGRARTAPSGSSGTYSSDIPFYQRVAGGAVDQYETQERIEDLRAQLSDQDRVIFELQVRGKLKESGNMSLMAAIGFIGVAGLPRFMMDDAGMGILYLLTGGLCLIGTIMDLVKMQEMVARYNQKVEMDELRLFLAMRARRPRPSES